MFKSFTIENFRCFKRLELPRLGRINLIAGRNDVGKTSLLEAIFLHLHPTDPRQSVKVDFFRGVLRADADADKTWGWLFHGRSVGQKSVLVSVAADGTRTLEIQLTPGGAAALLELRFRDSLGRESRTRGRLSSPSPTEPAGVFRETFERSSKDPNDPERMGLPPCLFYSSFYMNPSEEANYLDVLVRQRREGEVVEAIRKLDPRVSGVSLGFQAGAPVIYVDVALRERIPMAYLGDGATRLLRYLVGICNCRDAVVLIDEVENGFHHSILADVWRALDTACRNANVQLFATTHSWECIRAAAETFKDADEAAFAFHRLEQTPEGVKAVTAAPQAIEAAVASGFEVR